ncbi:MAG: hypothetical protein JWN88_1352 [Frankiales bacterium]|nr:hypothetical protein [Frankiales bacterium]
MTDLAASAAPPNAADMRAHMAFGTEEEGLAWTGRVTGPRPCADAITAREVKGFAAMLRDGNASYWDADWAQGAWGGLISPPAALMTWSWPLPWAPEGVTQSAPMLAPSVPLPGDRVVNASTSTTFLLPIHVGELLSVTERVEQVSRERQTALGAGHFITTRAEYHNRAGQLVATHDNVMLRYTAAPGGPTMATAARPAAAAVPPSSVANVLAPVIGHAIPSIHLAVTLETCAQNVAFSRDFLPVHYDSAYARESGAENAFLNTMFCHGFLDRVGTDWAGPTARVVQRDTRFISPVHVGHDVVASGRITAVERIGDRLDVGLDLALQSGPHTAVTSRTTLRLRPGTRTSSDERPCP